MSSDKCYCDVVAEDFLQAMNVLSSFSNQLNQPICVDLKFVSKRKPDPYRFVSKRKVYKDPLMESGRYPNGVEEYLEKHI